ncbi:MAG: methyltransferase domain-containing protein [Acidobacteria bacterium]|nr:methyltransferase domain-containing protein [Acidobacteriota bacterium]
MGGQLMVWIERTLLRIMQMVLTFKRNRIIRRHLPPGARKVADFGCGHFPNRYASVLVDSLDTEDIQRGGFRVDRGDQGRTFHDLDLNVFPYPFEDGYFDYLICSHVLEHLEDPLRTCSEFSRIAKAGYIEVPFGSVDIFIRNNDLIHRWLFAQEPATGTLLFTDRQGMIDAFPPPEISRMLRFLLQLRNLANVWEGRLPARYIPPPV